VIVIYNWNDKNIQKHYERTLKWAKEHDNFTTEELESLYLDKLYHQTKSHRIMRMISLAYTLGKLKGIQEIDEGKTPVTLR
jgi:demethoxyubiquinone hydroxylase (CLK1/Coq7/Cat5 family)